MSVKRKADTPRAQPKDVTSPAPEAAAKPTLKPSLKRAQKPAQKPAAKSPSVAAPHGEAPPPAVKARRPKLRRIQTTASNEPRKARFSVGDVVRHKYYPFRGVIFDIDPVFANTDEWWQAIPEKMRPRKDQPFYHLLAENAETEYVAYVSEQNLLPDTSGVPIRHPQVAEYFIEDEDGRYRPVFMSMLN